MTKILLLSIKLVRVKTAELFLAFLGKLNLAHYWSKGVLVTVFIDVFKAMHCRTFTFETPQAVTSHFKNTLSHCHLVFLLDWYS